MSPFAATGSLKNHSLPVGEQKVQEASPQSGWKGCMKQAQRGVDSCMEPSPHGSLRKEKGIGKNLTEFVFKLN